MDNNDSEKNNRMIFKMNKTSGELKTYFYDGKKYNRTYYLKNKDRLLEKNKCNICMGSYTKNTMNNHLKTKKHLSLMDRQHNEPTLYEL
jgi:hypothetical protein